MMSHAPTHSCKAADANCDARPGSIGRQAALALSLAGALLAQGCATASNRGDPLEPWNRQVFAFNESLDDAVLKPVAKGYKAITPEPVRSAFSNFVGNIKDVWSTANLFLQGRVKDGTLGVIRVSINSTLGLGGLIDMASPMQLDKPNEDLGQTLGVWGVKPGAYIVWPVLGPSTLRDSVGLPADLYFSSASSLGTYPREVNVLRAVELVHTRAGLLDAGNLIDDVALDKYAFMRDAYLQRRQNLIYEGDPPDEEPQPDPSLGPAQRGTGVPAAALPASAPASAARTSSSGRGVNEVAGAASSVAWQAASTERLACGAVWAPRAQGPAGQSAHITPFERTWSSQRRHAALEAHDDL